MCGTILWLYGLLTSAVFIFFGVKITEWSENADLISQLSTALSDDVKNDWLMKPFTDIVVTDDTFCPESHPDLVFDRPFYGTIPGCECYNNYHDYIHNSDAMGLHELCNYNQTVAGCLPAFPIQPIRMGQVKGKRICGARGAAAFINVERPKADLNCTEGYVPCFEPTID